MILYSRRAKPLRVSPGRLWRTGPLLRRPEQKSAHFSAGGEGMADKPMIGGQAVIEGVMMRRGDVRALAVRRSDGSIVVERRPWRRLTCMAWLDRPYMRGFPILIETLINGIQTLNRSAWYASQDEAEAELTGWQTACALGLSLLFAVALFIVAPHALALVMYWLGLGGDVDGLAFHIWDGIFKFAIFIGYIAVIARIPEIRRVFCYHGAEHKVLAAFEAGGEVSAASAAGFSRLHPRCGTTFMLFVFAMAIVLHAVLVPLFVTLWHPDSFWSRHLGTLLFKLLLVVPVSALSYELIRCAARMGRGWLRTCLRAPGLMLQRLTTFEPDASQLEVAVAALAGTLEPDEQTRLQLPAMVIDA